MIRTTGRFRLHYNRASAAPLVWCVATDDFELAVKSITCTVPMRSVFHVKATPDDEDGKPSAWFEVEGELVVKDGNATIARRRDASEFEREAIAILDKFGAAPRLAAERLDALRERHRRTTGPVAQAGTLTCGHKDGVHPNHRNYCEAACDRYGEGVCSLGWPL